MNHQSSSEVTAVTLSNGLTVAAERLPAAQTVTLGAWVRCGTRDEPPHLAGVAHFIEHMAFKGSPRRDTLALARAFETLGGTVDAYTTHEATCFSLQVLPEHLDDGLDLLSELLCDAAIEAEGVELEKQVVFEEIAESEDNPADIVQEVCAAAAWADHPLARPVLGTRQSIAALAPEVVRAWRDSHYTGQRVLLAAAGAVDAEQLSRAAEHWLGRLPAVGEPPALVTPTFHPGPAARRAPTDQVHLCLAAATGGAIDPDRHALWVIDMLLGATMSSRLFQEVRERRGLAYQISSSWQVQRDVGLLAIDAIASPKHVAELLAVVRDETAAIARDGVSEADLAWVKGYAVTTIRLAAESTSSQMARLARSFFYEGRHVPLVETLAAIQALEAEDLLRAARRLLAGRPWVLAAVGPVTAKKADKWYEVIGS
jgi:predicted Zn-dependent peptidase